MKKRSGLPKNYHDREIRAAIVRHSIVERASMYEGPDAPSRSGSETIEFYEKAFSQYQEHDASIQTEINTLIDDILGIKKVEPNREEYYRAVVERFVEYLRTELNHEWLTEDGYAHYKSKYW